MTNGVNFWYIRRFHHLPKNQGFVWVTQKYLEQTPIGSNLIFKVVIKESQLDDSPN